MQYFLFWLTSIAHVLAGSILFIPNSAVFYSLETTTASSQYVDFGTASDLNFERTDAFWTSSWIYVKSGAAESAIIGKGVTTPPGYRGWLVDWAPNPTVPGIGSTTNNLLFYILSDNATSNGIFVFGSNNCAPTGQWLNVISSYDGSSLVAGMKLWVNGTPITLTPNTGFVTVSGTIQNSEHVLLGKAYVYSDFYATQFAAGTGTIDNTKATTIYNAGVPLNTNSWGGATAVSWWALQNNFTDSVGANNGTSSGSPTFTTSFYP